MITLKQLAAFAAITATLTLQGQAQNSRSVPVSPPPAPAQAVPPPPPPVPPVPPVPPFLPIAPPEIAGESSSSKDTVLIRLRGSDKVMIITRRNAQNVSGLKEIDLNRIITRVDSLLRDETNTFRSVDVGGFRRLKDTTIFLKRNGARQRSVVVSVNGNGRQNRTIRIEDDNMHDRNIQVFKRRERRQRQTTDFYINFGLNNYLTEDGNFPDDDGAAYGLLPLGSRYIALGINHNIMLGHSPFSLNLGLEIAWNNFMLQEDNLLRKDTGGVSFLPAQIGYDDPISVQKSKFVQTLIKAPITLRTHLAKNLTIDLGGFAGYRIDSYTKLKYERDGSTRKDHDKGNFYLSNFQYGLKAQLNFKSVGIFGEYNLNPLFTANRGPDLRVFSFGVSI